MTNHLPPMRKTGNVADSHYKLAQIRLKYVKLDNSFANIPFSMVLVIFMDFYGFFRMDVWKVFVCCVDV